MKDKLTNIVEDIAKNIFKCEYEITWYDEYLNKEFVEPINSFIKEGKFNLLQIDDDIKKNYVAEVAFKKDGYYTEGPVKINFVLKDKVIILTDTFTYNDSWEPYIVYSENGLDYAVNILEIIYDACCENKWLLDVNNDELQDQMEKKLFKPFNERNNTLLTFWNGMFTSYTESKTLR